MNEPTPSPTPTESSPQEARRKWITMQVTIFREEYMETKKELDGLSEETGFDLPVAKFTARLFRNYRKMEMDRLRKSHGTGLSTKK